MSFTRITPVQKWDCRLDKDAGFQYVLAYMISELRLIPFEQWEDGFLEECLEARFFGRDSELHVFQEDGEWMAVFTQDLSEDAMQGLPVDADQKPADDDAKTGRPHATVMDFAFIDRVHPIRDNCKKNVPKRSELMIREYISYDEDGQAYTSKTRLVGLQ